MLDDDDFLLKSPEFAYDFGVRALPPDVCPFRRTVDVDEELALKRAVVADHRHEVLAALPDSAAACNEVCDWIQQAALSIQPGQADGLHRLEHVGLQIQEDLAIMAGDVAGGFPIVAGLVCFPSGWSIRDKLGRSMGHTHEDVPGFAEHMCEKTEKLFASMPPLRPVYRRNWAINPTDKLPRLPSQAEETARDRALVTADNAGVRCHFRVEYQTLTRMPHTGAIVFTILTLQAALDELTDAQAGLLAGVLRTCPDDVLQYKRLSEICEPVLGYLQQRLTS